MMSKTLKYIFMLLAIGLATELYAQDARIAHPFMWSSYYNPAYAGSECNIKVDLGAQTNYTYKPALFVDSHVSAEGGGVVGDHAILGCGVNVNNTYQGNGLLNITDINVVGSVGVFLTNNSRVVSSLHAGFGLEVDLSHINRDRMVLTDQLDAYYGKVSSYSSELEYINVDNLTSFDMCWGLYGKTSFSTKAGHPIMLDYGFSMFHTFGKDNKSFYSGQQSSIYMPYIYYPRFSGQLSLNCPFKTQRNTRMAMGMYGIYEYQGGMNDIQMGLVYRVFRFRIGAGVKVEKCYMDNDFKYSATNILFHVVYHQPLNRYSEMGIAYTFETPLTQGAVTETSIHSLSIHFIINNDKLRNVCYFFDVSDNAWYENNGTFPNTHKNDKRVRKY